ncbi:MAG: glycosyltransferase [Bacteroidota bacterium]
MRILHLTVLNPLTHTRIYHKLAISQANAGHEVHIAGQGKPAESLPSSQLFFHSTGTFYRLSLRRVLISFRLAQVIRRVKPVVIYVHTPELLLLGKWAHRKHRCQVIYDVHEDYFATIKGAEYYPAWIRHPLAKVIRTLEHRARNWLSGVQYAENCYDNILDISPKKYRVVRNTFSNRMLEKQADLQILEDDYLLLTGTLHDDWGLSATLDLWKELRKYLPLKLVVAGFAPQPESLSPVYGLQQTYPDEVFLYGGKTYLPYEHIIHLIQNCWAGTAFYHPFPHLQEKVPTKFYEFMAMRRPLLFTPFPYWVGINEGDKIGLALSEDLSPDKIIESLTEWKPTAEQEDFGWKIDEQRMLELLEKVIKIL